MNYKKISLVSFILIASLAVSCLGQPVKTPIRLVTRADDMGISHDINKGIIQSYRDGIVRNASLMAPCPYFDEAAKMCKANPGLSVGIHVTLVGMDPIRPVLDPEEIPTLVRGDGFFYRSGEAFAKAKPSFTDIEKETRAQIAKIRATGLNLVYLDVHILGVNHSPAFTALMRKICDNDQLLLSRLEGETEFVPGLLSWGDGWLSPENPKFIDNGEEIFYKMLGEIEPGLSIMWFHPGDYSYGTITLTDLLCNAKTKNMIKKRNIELTGYQQLWNEKFAKKCKTTCPKQTKMPIRLITWAHDMGISHDANKGIIKSYRDGIIRNASLMVPCPYFDEAVKMCKANPGLSTGIHVTLVGIDPIRPVLDPDEIPTLVRPDGFFYHSFEAFSKAKPSFADIEKEISAQIAKIRAAGLNPVCLDTHILSENYSPAFIALLRKICNENKLLLCGHEGETACELGLLSWADGYLMPENPKFIDNGEEIFYQMLEDLEPGLSIMSCHPGVYSYGAIRLTDLLCDAKTKNIIEKRNIELTGYQQLWNEKFAKKCKTNCNNKKGDS